MNIASKTLNKQRKRFVAGSLQGLALTIIGGFVGIMLLTEGLGKPSQGTKGKTALLLKLVKNIFGEGQDAEKIMAYILAGAMGIVVIFGIYYFLKGAYHMIPKHTMLGQSIVLQSKSYEKFSDVLAAINTDIDRESTAFGKVYIGRDWILEMEAMRLSQIRGVFWMNEGDFDFVLCCVDEAQNIWASSFMHQDERDNAIKYLQSRFPELVYGDKNAYISFLKKEMKIPELEEEEIEEEETFLTELSPTTTFSYVGLDGIPSSNFNMEEVLLNLNTLSEGQSFMLCPLQGESIEKISFQKSQEAFWEITVQYLLDKEERKKVFRMKDEDTKSILEDLLENKKLTKLVK